MVLRFGFPLAAERPLYSELKNTLRGLVRAPGFPLAAERPLYSELVDTDTTPSDTRIRTAPTQLLDDNTRIRSCETPALLDDITRRIRSLEVADAYKEKTTS